MKFAVIELDFDFPAEAAELLDDSTGGLDNSSEKIQLVVYKNGQPPETTKSHNIATLSFLNKEPQNLIDEAICLWAATHDVDIVLKNDLFENNINILRTNPEMAAWFDQLRLLNRAPPVSGHMKTQLAALRVQVPHIRSTFVRGHIRRHIRRLDCYSSLIRNSLVGLPLDLGGDRLYDLATIIQGLKGLQPNQNHIAALRSDGVETNQLEALYKTVRQAANSFADSVDQGMAPQLFIYMLVAFQVLAPQVGPSTRLQLLTRYLETAAVCLLIERGDIVYERAKIRLKFDTAERLNLNRNLGGVGALMLALQKLSLVDDTDLMLFKQLVSSRNNLLETHGFGHATQLSDFCEFEEAARKWATQRMTGSTRATYNTLLDNLEGLNTTAELSQSLKTQLSSLF